MRIKKIRSHYDEEAKKWYFSVVDIVEILTESKNPTIYWRFLKTRLKKEGKETVTNCSDSKMLSKDGKMRLTDVLDFEGTTGQKAITNESCLPQQKQRHIKCEKIIENILLEKIRIKLSKVDAVEIDKIKSLSIRKIKLSLR